MNREEALARVRSSADPWDVVIVGGGATGLGAALDAATRGYRTLLLEACDFGKGASSRSTKLAHGGVRYLRQGRMRLVRGSLRERAFLLRNAAHLSRPLDFVVPSAGLLESMAYAIGLRLYDLLGGGQSLGRSRRLSRREVAALLPTLATERLHGGVLFHDGQFDDARLLVDLARAAWQHGATVLNHARVAGLVRDGRDWTVSFVDEEGNARVEVPTRAVISAAGAFADEVRRLERPDAATLVRPSRGTHVVLERRFLPGDAAVLLPDVGDGRVAFLVPWRDRVLLGTTDVAMEAPEAEPRASAGEIRELLATAARSLREPPSVEDVRSVFAGVRPLVGAGGRSTASIPRDRLLQVSEGGLVTITAGKWTTYRAMAEEAVDRAAVVAGLPARPCRTATLVLEGAPSPRGVPITEEEVVRAARDEMARTVEDVLARRLGTLLVDARAAVAAAPEAARILARELDRSEEWARAQVADFRELARAYLPDGLADW